MLNLKSPDNRHTDDVRAFSIFTTMKVIISTLILIVSMSISSFAQERRISVQQVQHVVAANFGELVFGKAIVWYEYRNTDLFGVRFPIGYNFEKERLMLGVNPRAYFGYGAIQFFMGPRIFVNYLKTPLPPIDNFSNDRFFTIEMFLDAGISFTNYKHIPFHFSINFGIGGESTGQSGELVFSPGISIGWNIQ